MIGVDEDAAARVVGRRRVQTDQIAYFIAGEVPRERVARLRPPSGHDGSLQGTLIDVEVVSPCAATIDEICASPVGEAGGIRRPSCSHGHWGLSTPPT
jgi:hypothetical protein